MDKVHTITEAAAILKLSKDKLYKLIAAGDMPHKRVTDEAGSKVLLTDKDIQTWLDSRQASTNEQ